MYHNQRGRCRNQIIGASRRRALQAVVDAIEPSRHRSDFNLAQACW
jgi:hypothetical protein